MQIINTIKDRFSRTKTKKVLTIGTFDWYLKNTTIFEHRDPIINRNYARNIHYKPINVNGVYFFGVQSFFLFIDEILKRKNIVSKDDYIDKIQQIIIFGIQKITDNEQKKSLYSISRNIETFLSKCVIGKEYSDGNGRVISLLDYTYTDAENFYRSIGDDSIVKLFKANKNIMKIRETRNRFIEHKNDKKHFQGNDFRRRVKFLGGGDNNVGRVHIKIFIDVENKEYEFTIAPLLDFCVFIDELMKI